MDLAGTDDIGIELVILAAGGYGVYAAPNAPLPAAGRLTAVLTWLAGTRAGRWLATISAGALIALGIFARVYGAGQRAEESRQGPDSLDDLRSRNRTDD